jgi:cytochrome c556
MPNLIPSNVDHITPDHFIHHAIRQGEHRARAHNIHENLKLLQLHRPFDQNSISYHLRLLEHENTMAQKLASETDGIFQRYEQETRQGADKHAQQKLGEMQKKLQHAHDKEREELHNTADGLKALHADIQSQLARTQDEHESCTAQLRQKQAEYEELNERYLMAQKFIKRIYKTFEINESDSPEKQNTRLREIYDEHKQLENIKKRVKVAHVDDIFNLLEHYKARVDTLEAEIRNLTRQRDEHTETIENHLREMKNVGQVHGIVDAQLRSHEAREVERPANGTGHASGGSGRLKSLYKAASQGWGDWAAGTHRW